MGEPRLERKKMRVSTVVFMIFCVCAAGAYGLEAMIPAAGPGLTIVMILIIPLIWSLPMGLVCAELGAARPVSGGSYRWVQEAMGEFWGFQTGWWKILTAIVDPTIYVVLAGGYLGYVFDLPSIYVYIFQILIILLFVFINLRGIKEVGRVSMILSITVLCLFALIAVLGFAHWNINPVNPFIPEGQSLMGSIGNAIMIGLWMFAGYEAITPLAGEVEDPKVIPKATLLALPLVVMCYLLPTVGGLASIGQWESWSPEMGGVGYGTVLIQYAGPAFGIIFGIVAILSQCSMYNTGLTNGSRVFYAMADDNLAPPVFAKISKKGNVPAVAIVVIGIIDMMLCTLDFTVVVVIDVMLILSFHILLFISALILRKKIPEEERPMKIPGGYGLLAVICCVPIALAVISFLINGADYFLAGSLALVSGPVMYVLWKRRYGGLTKKDPKTYPINEKTKLDKGDLYKISIVLFVFGIFSFIGRLFIGWYEKDWGQEYYMDTYGADIFGMLLNGILLFAIVTVAAGIITYGFARKLEKQEIKQ